MKKKNIKKCDFCGKKVPASELKFGGITVATGKVDLACKKCY
jgi:hypothetical protein